MADLFAYFIENTEWVNRVNTECYLHFVKWPISIFRFVCLLEKSASHADSLCHLDRILSGESSGTYLSDEQARDVPPLLELLSTARDRTILQYVLASIFNKNSLHMMLGYTSSMIDNTKTQVGGLLREAETIREGLTKKVDNELSSIATKLKECIEKEEASLQRKRKTLSKEEEEDLQFEVDNKKRHLMKIKSKPKHVIQSKAKRHFSSWKQSFKSQKGKGKGKYQIDRGAEIAVYKILEEQVKAHHRRSEERRVGKECRSRWSPYH